MDNSISIRQSDLLEIIPVFVREDLSTIDNIKTKIAIVSIARNDTPIPTLSFSLTTSCTNVAIVQSCTNAAIVHPMTNMKYNLIGTGFYITRLQFGSNNLSKSASLRNQDLYPILNFIRIKENFLPSGIKGIRVFIKIDQRGQSSDE